MEKMRLASITGLFGANSSGKTSILQLLLMLKQTVESTDRTQVLTFGDEKSLTNLGGYKDVVYGHNLVSNITFEVKWNLLEQLHVFSPEDIKQMLFSTKQLAFFCKIGENGTGKLAVYHLDYEAAGYRFALTRKEQVGSEYELHSSESNFHFIRFPGREGSLPLPVKCYGFPDQVYAAYQNAGFLAELQLEFEDLMGRVYYLGPLREFPHRYYAWNASDPADMGLRGENVVDALLSAKQRGAYLTQSQTEIRLSLEQQVARWLKELGLIHSFSVVPVAVDTNIYQVRVQKTSSSAPVLITDVGFGVSQILPVLVLCYYAPEGSIILLEQPEIHLHPAVQSGLADVLIDAVKTRKVQIIVESHSEHLLRRLQRRIAEQSISPEETTLYFCEAVNEGSKLMPLHVDMFGNITNWPPAFFGDEFVEMAAMTKAAVRRKQENRE